MRDLLTTIGLVAGPLALFWVVWLCIGQNLRATALADIARIEEGLPDPTPVPEPEPLRRIDWIVDEEFEAMVRAVRWPTDELARIKAEVGV